MSVKIHVKLSRSTKKVLIKTTCNWQRLINIKNEQSLRIVIKKSSDIDFN